MILDIIIYTPMYVTAFWSILLFSINKPFYNRAKFVLAVFMSAAFLLYVAHAVYFKHLYSAFRFFDPIYSLCSLSVYPLYYWYIKLLTIETSYRWKNLIMLLPAILISGLTALTYLVMEKDEAIQYILKFHYHRQSEFNTNPVQIQSIFFYMGRTIFSIQVIYFLVFGSRLVKRYNERIANFYSNIEGKSILWVRLLLISFVFTSFMSIIFNLLGRTLFDESIYLLLIPSIIFSTLLFFIGFQGFLQNYTVAELVEDEEVNSKIDVKLLSRNKLKIKLLHLFNSEEIYTNSDLKITQVTEKLNTNRTYLSNLINEEFKCTFSDFVGKFRVQKAKELFENDREIRLSIDYIAEQVGFGSTSSFIRMFKKIEGITPGIYHSKVSRKNNTLPGHKIST